MTRYESFPSCIRINKSRQREPNERDRMNTTEPNGKSASLLACPSCKAPLRSQGMAYVCAKCHQSYPLTDGILAMATRSTQLGEFSNEEMLGFLRAAEK